MWYKGVVIELLANQVAIILTDEGEFVKIKQKEKMEIGQTILFLEDDKMVEQVIHFKPKKKLFIPTLVAIAAMLLLVFIPNLSQQTAYAILSVDINPSFELELDESLTIVGVKTLNDSADMLVLDQVIGLTLEQGLDVIRNLLSESDYALTEDSMLFGLAFLGQEDLAYEESVKQSLKTANVSQEFAYFKVSSEELEVAQSQHMSAAKMKAKEMLDDIDVEELSINQIMQLFEAANLKFDMRCKNGEEIEDILEDYLDEIEDQGADEVDEDDSEDEVDDDDSEGEEMDDNFDDEESDDDYDDEESNDDDDEKHCMDDED